MMANQQGSVLLLTMVFLLLTSWVTLSLLESSLFFSRLFAQQQQKSDDLLQAENYLTTLLLENKAQLKQKRTVAYRSCAPQLDNVCDDNALQLSTPMPSAVQLTYYADYQGDDEQRNYWQLHMRYQSTTPLELTVGISVAREASTLSTNYSNAEGEWRFY